MNQRGNFSLTKALTFAVVLIPKATLRALIPLLAVATLVCVLPYIAHEGRTGVGLRVITMLGLGLFTVMSLGACYRISLYDLNAKTEGPGFLGLQFGAAEMRILAATFLVVLFLVCILAVMSMIMLIGLNSIGHEVVTFPVQWREDLLAFEAWPYWAIGLFALLSAVIWLFTALKLSLCQPASIVQKHIVSLNALTYGEGQAGRLLVGIVVLLLPVIAIWTLGSFIGISPEKGGWVRALATLVSSIWLLITFPGFLSSAYSQIMALHAK